VANTPGGNDRGTRSFRPDLDVYGDVMKRLAARLLHMDDFLRACLAWFRHDPDAALEALFPYWPAPRLRGKPSHRSQRTEDTGRAGT
jgi:hypothetical protein